MYNLRTAFGYAEVVANYAMQRGIHTVDTIDCPLGRVVEYMKDGFLHRIGGPAHMNIDPETGIVKEEIWCQEGVYHRVDGPAMVKRDAETGKVMEALWWNKGEPISHPNAITEGRLASVVRAEAARHASQATGPR